VVRDGWWRSPPGLSGVHFEFENRIEGFDFKANLDKLREMGWQPASWNFRCCGGGRWDSWVVSMRSGREASEPQSGDGENTHGDFRRVGGRVKVFR